MQGALSAIDGLAGAIFCEELHGALGEQAANFAPPTFFPGNNHGVVTGCLMTEPRDGGGFGALLDGDALRAGDGAAADGRGVFRDEVGEGVGFETERGVEGEEADDRVTEVHGVVLFLDRAALAAGVKFSLIRGVGAFDDEIRAQGLEAGGGGPDAARETLAAFELDDGEAGAVLFDAAAERGVAGREERPVGGHGFEDAVFVKDMAGEGSGTDFAGEGEHRMVEAGGGGSVAEGGQSGRNTFKGDGLHHNPMKKIPTLLALAFTCSLAVQAAELVKKWETPATLFTPESVLFSANDKVLYVSNIGAGTDPWAKDGNGSIAKVGLDGKVIAAEWVKGLDAPKGLGLRAGKLYVADLSRVVVIDVAKGAIEKTIEIEGAKGLNDITVDAAGVVYVSEFKAGKVYAITGGKPVLFLAGLKTPNGLLAHGKVLYVLDSGGLSVTGAGPSKALTKIVDGLEGGTDGIEHIKGDEFIVSCWGGVVYHVNVATKQQQVLLDTRAAKVHSADIGYDAAKRMVYVPTFFTNTVVAYEVK